MTTVGRAVVARMAGKPALVEEMTIGDPGPGVTRPAVGGSVVLPWRAPGGNRRFCLAGQPSLSAARRSVRSSGFRTKRCLD